MTVPNKVEVKSMIVYLEIFYEGPLIYITGEQPFQDSSIRRFAIGLFLSVISGYVKSSRWEINDPKMQIVELIGIQIM